MSIVAVHGPSMLGEGGGTDPPPVGTNPVITGIAPASIPLSGGVVTIVVTGSDFQPDADVEFDQVAGVTTYVSASSVSAPFTPTVAGTVLVTVRNDALAAESNDFPLTVTAAAADPAAYDPGEHTVDEVKAYVADCHIDEVREILALEVAGKNRTTLVAFLEALLPFDPAEYSVEEVKEYAEAYPEEAEAILAAENEGKARITLVGFLEALIEAPAEDDEAE